MDNLKVCITCGQLAAGTRCDDCQSAHTRRIDQQRGGREARGYGPTWRRRAKQIIRLNPACIDCGSTDDLTVDHIIPKARGGTDEPENLATRCRTHNSSKGAQ